LNDDDLTELLVKIFLENFAATGSEPGTEAIELYRQAVTEARRQIASEGSDQKKKCRKRV
jgi:hypothetical protein